MTGESKSSAQRRQRIQLSCQPCRIGKLKCSRELPCEQCTKRSRETSCVYTPGAQESISFKTQAKAMREKLENLERAVKHFKEADQRRVVGTTDTDGFGLQADLSAIEPDGDLSPTSIQGLRASPSARRSPSTTSGHLIRSNEDGSAYVGPSHWQSIINDIAEVKACFEHQRTRDGGGLSSPEESRSVSSLAPSNSPDLLLGISPTICKETLMYSIPPKNVADRLLAAFFGSMDMCRPVIHVPTFQAQYHNFWQQPELASSAWLALLFTVFALGFQYSMQNNRDKDPIYDNNSYLELAAHAIGLADYTKPKAFTVESLLLYIRCCQMQEAEQQFKDWLGLGLVVRICMRMGYHRDPVHYPNMSPFEGEMRRRIWLFVCLFDVTMSYQIGLVSNITSSNSAVRLPRNLHDSDFGPDSAELPPSRPPNDFTQMSHIVHFGRIIPLFAKAVSLSHSLAAPNVEEVAAVATRLQLVMDEIPPPLVIVPSEQAMTDSPDTIFKRFALELLVQKARCVLFRRYLGSNEYEARRACIDAALRSLDIQKALEETSLPGGPLCNSPPQQYRDLMDAFLLAGMIVAVEISAVRGQPPDEERFYTQVELRAMSQKLQTSCNIIETSLTAHDKAKCAARALQSVLQPEGDAQDAAYETEFAYPGLVHTDGAQMTHVQDQWLRQSGNPLQPFDLDSLGAGNIVPYPIPSNAHSMQLDYPAIPSDAVDWMQSGDTFYA